LPQAFHVPEPVAPPPSPNESPLPQEWSEGSKAIRDIADAVDEFLKGL
jgi:hypothetical protein